VALEQQGREMTVHATNCQAAVNPLHRGSCLVVAGATAGTPYEPTAPWPTETAPTFAAYEQVERPGQMSSADESTSEGADTMHISSADDAFQELIATPATGGHCGEVVDACWGAHNCLFTASTDRTIRITVSGPVEGAWYELARPQVHGHPFSAVAFIPPSSTNPWEFRYASASEEKVIRIFCAPSIFVQSFARLQGMTISKNITAVSAARVSPLGLSNKAVEDANKEGCTKPESAGYEYDTRQASQVKHTHIFEV
jgi:hypothetical protein